MSICDYLFTCLEILIQFKENRRDYSLFKIIIYMCLPFELGKPKKKIKEMKQYVTEINIDNKP